MHSSTRLRMKWAVDNYIEYFPRTEGIIRVLDVGSYDVNGSYRDLFDNNFKYLGADIEAGPNVDIVLDDVYHWSNISPECFDLIISGQAFEHIEFPWLTISEMTRVLKPDGYMIIIAPHTAREHKYPYDCYRYYSDGLSALAKSCGLQVLHSSIAGVPNYFVGEDWNDSSNDAMVVLKKPGVINITDTPQLGGERRVYDFEYKYRYRFMLNWIKYLESNYTMHDYLVEQRWNDVIVYGLNEVAFLIVQDILESGGNVKCIITYDTEVMKKCNIYNCKILTCHVDEFDKQADAIIIADADYQKRIETQLKLFSPNICTADSIVEGILKRNGINNA